jgi:catechol 2,3-dioxygenase-like lactoylglutathione lyase family enzyme
LKEYFALRTLAPGDEKFTVLMDDNGMVLTLMKAGQAIKYPGSFHIGFIQENEEQVDELYRRLKADGFDVAPPRRSHAWTFYVNAPGGFLVEILA